MYFPFFAAKRIIFNAQPSFSRFIIRLAVAATALSVAAMVITLSMVNGFQDAVAQKVFSFWGDIRVQELAPARSIVSEDEGFLRTDSIEDPVRKLAQASHYHAFAIKSVVLKSSQNLEGILMKGVDSLFSDAAFSPFMLPNQGRINFNDSLYARQILISRSTAERLSVRQGDTLQVFFIRNNEEFRSRPIVVGGLFNTGIEEYDKNFALADIRFLQKLNKWPQNRIGGFEIWLQNKSNLDDASIALNRALPLQMQSQTIQEVFPNIFDWLGIQNQTKQIVIGTMLVVAIINLITSLLILVMERTKMVGVLKALGMTSGSIGTIFWLYASWIALVGVGAGLFVGWGLCIVQQLTGIITMDEATYYVAVMPIKIIGWQICAVAGGSLVICMLAITLPLSYVQQISPVKAIRFD